MLPDEALSSVQLCSTLHQKREKKTTKGKENAPVGNVHLYATQNEQELCKQHNITLCKNISQQIHWELLFC